MGAAGVGWQTVWLGPIGQGYCANCLARNVSTPSDSNNWRSEAWWSCIFVANVCRTPLDPCPSSVCRACGNVFRVRDAQVVAKAHDYICPVFKGNVASNVKTGKIWENRPSNSLWEPVFCEGRRCEGEGLCLPVSTLQGQCGKRRQDSADQSSKSVRQPVLC